MRERYKTLMLVPPVHRTTHRIGLFLQDRRPSLGVSQGEAHVLAQLGACGPCAVGDLHAAFAHRRSTLTGILDRLVDRGLVRRDVRPEDRRSFRVSLTAKGRGLARRVHAALAELEAAAARRVTLADLAGFEAVLAALQEASGRRAGNAAKAERP